VCSPIGNPSGCVFGINLAGSGEEGWGEPSSPDPTETTTTTPTLSEKNRKFFLGGELPPGKKKLAKNQPRFDVEDFERLFRAILPDAIPDPFGEIRTALVTLGERFEEEVKETDTYRDKADETRDAIQSRTFGILLLQIFKTLKLMFGFLPQGRIILIIIAVMGLATTLLNDKPVTLAGIRKAVESTGIADFIDSILEELKKSVGEMATELSDVGDIISVQVAQSAGKFENIEQLLAITEGDVQVALNFFNNFTNQISPGFEALGEGARTSLETSLRALSGALGNATLGANAMSNVDVFLMPILRRLPDEIKKIPDLAGKLIRFA